MTQTNKSHVVMHNSDIEQALLSIALRHPIDVSELLSASDFYSPEHADIWSAIQGMVSKGHAVDPVTISNAVKRVSNQDIFDYVSSLYEINPPIESAYTYAHEIKEYSFARFAYAQTSKFETITSSAMSSKEKRSSIASLISQIEDAAPVENKTVSLREALQVKKEMMAKVSSGEITPMSTGLEDLDAITNGLMGGELIILAGRPSMGKTALAMNIAENAAIKHSKHTYVFSLEMQAHELAGRSACSIGSINTYKLRNGLLTEDELLRYNEAIEMAGQMPITIDDRPELSVEEMVRSIRRFVRMGNPLNLIVIDYLQITNSELIKSFERTNLVTYISGKLKAMAKEFNVPVIALSQLSRNLEQRADKRPMMSDLRESGAIEQDADMILFVYRDEVYHKDTPMPGKAEIIVGKNRSGTPGVAILDFVGKYSRFENSENSDTESQWVEVGL